MLNYLLSARKAQLDFEAELTANGYNQIETKTLDPKLPNSAHAHDYDIRGLVMSGVFIVWQNDRPISHSAGHAVAVPAGTKHAEEIGPDGARILIGRKY